MKPYLLGLCLLMSLCLSCQRQQASESYDITASSDIYDLTADADAWADSVCSTLSLRAKVGQLFMPAVYAAADIWTLRQITQYADSCIGGIVLLKGDVEGASALLDSLARASNIRPFAAIDAEWGLAMRLADAPRFPANSSIGPSADDQLMYDYGREVASQCREIGINMVLGPVVDVSGPDSFMLRRSLGNDPRRVAELSIAYARGLEDGDVISVAKHFPGHGSVSADSHKAKGVILKSLNEMDSVDIYPFKKWIEQNLTAVMVGHLAVPSIDSGMLPAAVSPTVITDLLRDDLGFKGLVITDAINMKGAEGYGGVDALLAGADIIIAPGNTFAEIEKIVNAVDEGRISESLVDTHVKRILFYKYLFGLDSLSNNSEVHSSSFDSSPSSLSSHQKADSISMKLRR